MLSISFKIDFVRAIKPIVFKRRRLPGEVWTTSFISWIRESSEGGSWLVVKLNCVLFIVDVMIVHRKESKFNKFDTLEVPSVLYDGTKEHVGQG